MTVRVASPAMLHDAITPPTVITANRRTQRRAEFANDNIFHQSAGLCIFSLNILCLTYHQNLFIYFGMTDFQPSCWKASIKSIHLTTNSKWIPPGRRKKPYSAGRLSNMNMLTIGKHKGQGIVMSNTNKDEKELPDPAEYVELMKNLAEKSQKIVTAFLKREPQSYTEPNDPLNLNEALTELTRQMLNNPAKLI
jgi:hypothetical protein